MGIFSSLHQRLYTQVLAFRTKKSGERRRELGLSGVTAKYSSYATAIHAQEEEGHN